MRKLPIMRKSRTDESSSVSKEQRGVYLCSVSTKASAGGLGLSISLRGLKVYLDAAVEVQSHTADVVRDL